MIHIIPHHIAVGSYTRWYNMIDFDGDFIFHEFEDKEEIERKLIGEPPYEDRLISHLNKIKPTSKDVVVFDYQYLNGLDTSRLSVRLNQLSRNYNNCKFLLFDDDNRHPYVDTERYTIFSNIFQVYREDSQILNDNDLNCNYYRYRACFQDYFVNIEPIITKFQLNIRQKKTNLFVGVDKLERLEIFKYFYNIGLDKDSYTAYSGFTSTYDDSQINKHLQEFKKSHIPKILDTPFWMSEMGSVNVEIPPLPFTMNSYFSCILETQMLDGGLVHLSEKSWNPFISKNIPLILGSSYINKYLMDIGFWLADDLFDLSINHTTTDIINQYKSNLDIINKMTYDEIHEYYKKNINNIDRNFDLIKYAKFIYKQDNYKSLNNRNI